MWQRPPPPLYVMMKCDPAPNSDLFYTHKIQLIIALTYSVENTYKQRKNHTSDKCERNSMCAEAKNEIQPTGSGKKSIYFYLSVQYSSFICSNQTCFAVPHIVWRLANSSGYRMFVHSFLVFPSKLFAIIRQCVPATIRQKTCTPLPRDECTAGCQQPQPQPSANIKAFVAISHLNPFTFLLCLFHACITHHIFTSYKLYGSQAHGGRPTTTTKQFKFQVHTHEAFLSNSNTQNVRKLRAARCIYVCCYCVALVAVMIILVYYWFEFVCFCFFFFLSFHKSEVRPFVSTKTLKCK